MRVEAGLDRWSDRSCIPVRLDDLNMMVAKAGMGLLKPDLLSPLHYIIEGGKPRAMYAPCFLPSCLPLRIMLT